MPELDETLSYGDVAQIHRNLGEQSERFKKMPLSEFAKWANETTGSQQFAQGLNDDKFRQLNDFLQRNVYKPVGKPMGEIASDVANKVMPESPRVAAFAKSFGESIPRTVADVGMTMLPGGLAIAASDAALNTYGETGSGKAAAASAAGFALLPKVGELGAQIGGDLVRKSLYDAAETAAGSIAGLVRPAAMTGLGALERASEKIGSQIAMATDLELTQQAESYFATGHLQALTPEHLATLAAQQLPWALLDIPGVIKPPEGVAAAGYQSATAMRAANMLSKAKADAEVAQRQAEPAVVAAPNDTPAAGTTQDGFTFAVKAQETQAKVKQEAQDTLNVVLKAKPGEIVTPTDLAKISNEMQQTLLESGILEKQADGNLRFTAEVNANADQLVAEAQAAEPKLEVKNMDAIRPGEEETPRPTPISHHWAEQFGFTVPSEGGTYETQVLEGNWPKAGPSRNPSGDELGTASGAFKKLQAEWLELDANLQQEVANQTKRQAAGLPYSDEQTKKLVTAKAQLATKLMQDYGLYPSVFNRVEKPVEINVPEKNFNEKSPIELSADVMQTGDKMPVQGEDPLIAMLKRIYEPQAVERMNLQQPLKELPPQLRLTFAARVRDMLATTLKEALTLRTAKDVVFAQHSQYAELTKNFDNAMEHVQTLMDLGLTPQEAMARTYTAVMAHIAKLTKTLGELNGWEADHLMSGENAEKVHAELDKTVITQRLSDLEKLSYGPAVLRGLVDIISNKLVFTSQGGSHAVDAGLISDPAYFRMLDRAGELVNVEKWKGVLETWFTKRPDDRMQYVTANAKQKFEIEKAATSHYLQFYPKDERDPWTRELMQRAYLEDIAQKAKTSISELNLQSLSDLVRKTPEETAQVDAEFKWLSGFDKPMSAEEWNKDGVLQLVEDVKTRKTEPHWTAPEATQAKWEQNRNVEDKARKLGAFNGILAMLRSGELKITRRNNGFRITEPELGDKRIILEELGFKVGESDSAVESQWKNFRNRQVQDVMDRLNAKYERWAQGELERLGLESKDATNGFGLTKSKVDNGLIPNLQRRDWELRYGPQGAVDKLNTAAGMREFFKLKAQELGLPPETIKLYSDIATRLALTFDQYGHGQIGELVADNILGQTRRLAGKSPYVITLNKATRENLSPEQQMQNLAATLAHELFHGEYSPTTRNALPQDRKILYDAAEAYATELTADERATYLEQMFRQVYGENHNRQEFLNVRKGIARDNPEEFLADMASLVTMGYAQPNTTRIDGWLRFAPAPVVQFVKNIARGVMDLLRMVSSRIRETYPKSDEKFTALLENMQKITKPIKDVDVATATLQRLEQFEPEIYEQLVARGSYDPEKVKTDDALFSSREFGIDTKNLDITGALNTAATALGLKQSPEERAKFGVSVSWLQRNFMLSGQLQRLYPQLRRVFDVAYNYRSMATDMANDILKPMLITTKFLKRQVIDSEGSGLRKVLSSQAANDAFSQIMLKSNMWHREGLGELPEALRESMLKNLPEGDKQAVRDLYKNVKIVMPELQKYMVKMLSVTPGFTAAQHLLASNPGMRAKEATTIGRQIAEAAWMVSGADPIQAKLGNAALTAFEQLTYKGMQAAISAVQALQLPVRQFEQRTSKPGVWMSEMRVGKYFVGYTNAKAKADVDKTGLAGFDTKAEALAWMVKEQKRTGLPETAFHVYDRWMQHDNLSGVNPDLIKTLREITDAAQMHAVSEMGLSEGLTKKVLSFTPMESVLKELHNSDLGGALNERNLRAGRETVNMADGFLRHVHSMTTYLAKEYATKLAGAELADPGLRENKELLQLAHDHLHNVLNPTARELSFLKRASFAYYLGLNPSSLLIQSLDTIQLLPAQLTQDCGSAMQSYKYWGKAVNTIKDMALSGSKGNATTGNPALDGAIAEARKRGIIDYGVMQEMYDAETVASLNIRALMQGQNKVVTAGKLAMNAVDLFAMVSRQLFSYAPRINNNIAYIASYMLAVEHGVLREGKLMKLGPTEAAEYADSVTRMTGMGGGAAARPVGMFSNMGKAQSVVGLAYSLGTYTMGALSMMGRLGLQSIQASTLSAAEKSATRKAFGQVLMTQAALSGVIGMPGALITMSVLNKLFGLEARTAVEDGVKTLFGGDDETGNLVSDIAMRGFANKVLGTDLSSRLELSSIMGISGYGDISVAQMLGPIGGVLQNMVKAVQQGAQGQYGAAAQSIVPQAFKHALELYQNDGVLRDKAGHLLLKPTDYESAMYVAGFKPSRLTALKDKQEQIQQHENNVKLEARNFEQQQATALEAGKINEVRAALYQREKATGGLYNAARGATEIAAAAVDRSAPLDIARSGSALGGAERRRLAATLGPRDTLTEVQRLQQKKALEAQLGAPGPTVVSPTELHLAMIVDNLMATNPLLGRAEAIKMAKVVLGRIEPRLRGAVEEPVAE